jgi:hypothetical protein
VWPRACTSAPPSLSFPSFDGCEPELFGQIRHGSDRVLVVARQKDDPVAALDDRIGRQGGGRQVIETFHELGAGERLRDEGGGQEAVQLLRELETSSSHR